MRGTMWTVWCWIALATTALAWADVPEPKNKLVQPAIVLRQTPEEWVRIYLESEKNPATLLRYLDEHVRFMESRKDSRLVYEFSDPRDLQMAETFGYVFTRIADVGTPDMLPALQQYIQRRKEQNDWASARDIARVQLAMEHIEARARGREAYRETLLNWVQHWESCPDAIGSDGKPTARACMRFAKGVRALAMLGDPRDLEVILKAWERAEREMPRWPWVLNRPLIVHALAHFDDARVLPLLRENLYMYRLAPFWDYPLHPSEKDPVWAYWRIRTKGMSLRQTVQVMLQAAGGEGPPRAIVDVLSHFGDDAIPVLLEFLHNPPPCPQPEKAVHAIVAALGELRAKQAVQPLLDTLSSASNPVLRRVGVRALGQIGDPTALPFLIQAARSDDILLRLGAISAMGMLADPRAEPLLLELLTTAPDARIRYAAAEALRTAGTASAIPVLEQRLQVEPNGSVLGRIETALQALRQKVR